ncbi:hypothetical protein BJX76DRAFT_356907 [Aspergillus varians]
MGMNPPPKCHDSGSNTPIPNLSIYPYQSPARPHQQEVAKVSTHESALAQTERTGQNVPVSRALKHLVDTDGAGTWPPKATHGNTWPAALRPYHAIYLELAPYLATEDVVVDNDINAERCNSFRKRMREALQERVNLADVKAILSATETGNREENGNEQALTAARYNGFSACIANLRHAFRWGVVPVVRVVQEEKIIDFPPELDMPWPFICRRYGVTSMGGNVMANYFCNFDDQERIVYQINCGLSDVIRTAEYNFAHMFVVIERLSLPIYHEMAQAITHFSTGNEKACLASLRAINAQFPAPLKVFYKTLVDTHISPKVWMHYVQGPTGWAAGEIIDGEYVEYDGLSGSHIPVFRIADAFLGVPAYFTEENLRRYIPRAQREFCDALCGFGLRERAREAGNGLIEGEMEKMVKQLRAFRATHRGRIHKYLSAPAPERLIMTAGKSVLESEQIPKIETAIQHLDGILAKRIEETK